MSEGPIKQARDAWKPPMVSTADAHRVCAVGVGPTAGRAYCGRSATKGSTADWDAVTCSDCHAARRADGVSA